MAWLVELSSDGYYVAKCIRCGALSLPIASRTLGEPQALFDRFAKQGWHQGECETCWLMHWDGRMAYAAPFE